MNIELILKYFPEINEEQQRQFSMLQELYAEWNAKINVISRKDIDNLYEHHVLHSLAIAKAIHFRDGSKILDLGTGGGFPGIPLAIMFPKCGEDEKGKYDFVVSRAVMPMPDLVKLVRKNISSKQQNAMVNGVIALKGGDVQAEIYPFRKIAEVSDIYKWFGEEWFKEKHIIYVPC